MITTRPTCITLSATALLPSSESQDSGAALCGPNSASAGAGTGHPHSAIVSPLLVAHRAELTCLGEDQYELRYPVVVPRFAERAIDLIDIVFPIAAESEERALAIAEIVLAGHTPPELPQAQPVAEEITPVPRAGYHRSGIDGNRTGRET